MLCIIIYFKHLANRFSGLGWRVLMHKESCRPAVEVYQTIINENDRHLSALSGVKLSVY